MEKPGYTYSEADLRRYSEGKMSPAEMHALEAAALNDPFLGDALEGYQLSPNPSADLDKLHTALEARIRKETRKKTPVFFLKQNPVWRVAAVVIVLAGLGWVAYQLPFFAQKEVALQTQKAPVKLDSKIENKEATADSIVLTYTTTKPEELKAPVANNATKRSLPITGSARKTPVLKRSTGGEKDIAIEVQKEKADIAQDRVTQVLQRNNERTSVASAPSVVQNINGKVVDNTGNAVPFASVTIRGDKNAMQTDANGNFTIAVPDSQVNAMVSAAGYQSNQAFLSPAMQNQVVLNRQSASLEEVVVSARMPATKKRAAVTVVEGQLEPKEGWMRYNEYITEGLNEPEKLETKQVNGEVLLSFDVNHAGEPINIHVEKSLCPVCDLKAVRLLKEGPKWKPGKGRKGSILIRF